MSREFRYPRHYYTDRQIYKRGTITINNGITILVECNGSGKSTLMRIIKEDLEKNNIPHIFYDNKESGGSYSMEEAHFYNDFDRLINLAFSSEGEQITLNINNKSKEMVNFLKEGLTNEDKRHMLFIKAFTENEEINNFEVRENNKERWFLFDAIDSGYSIDNVIDFKKYVLEPLFEKAKEFDKDVYFVISCNEYEMCENLPCFSVMDGKYIDINSYEDFKHQILLSRTFKDSSINKYEAKFKEE